VTDVESHHEDTDVAPSTAALTFIGTATSLLELTA